MRTRKAFSMPINLLLAMTVLLILAAVVAVLTNQYTGQFEVFGTNQTSNGLQLFN